MKRSSLKNKLTPLFWPSVAVLYALILVFIGFSAYTNTLPAYLGKIPYYDTIGHFVLYALATYLGHRVLKRYKMRILGVTIPLFPLSFGIITVVDECLQSLSPNRTFSYIDLTASLLGLYFGYWLVNKTHKSRKLTDEKSS